MKIYSDGGSRGNPGPAAIAFIILTENDEFKKSRLLGIRTNNQAEYEALIAALEYVSEPSSQDVTCYLDSELVVNQLNGEYKVKNPELRALRLRVKRLQDRFRTVRFVHVPRTNPFIQKVDLMLNRRLDEAKSYPSLPHQWG